MAGSEMFWGLVRFALPTVPVVFAVRFVYLVFREPEKILQMEDDAREYRAAWWDRGPRYRIWAVLQFMLALLGIGIFIYGGTRSSLSGLPSWLGVANQDGEYVTVRDAASLVTAMWAAPFVMQWLSRRATSNAQRRQNIETGMTD